MALCYARLKSVISRARPWIAFASWRKRVAMASSRREPSHTATTSLRESPNAEGNRQPDHDHVDKQPLNHVMKFVRAPFVKRGERQNDVTHYHLNCGTKEQAAHQRVLLQKNQSAACREVNTCRRESNKEVQEDTQEIGGYPSLQSLPSQQARGNH